MKGFSSRLIGRPWQRVLPVVIGMVMAILPFSAAFAHPALQDTRPLVNISEANDAGASAPWVRAAAARRAGTSAPPVNISAANDAGASAPWVREAREAAGAPPVNITAANDAGASAPWVREARKAAGAPSVNITAANDAGASAPWVKATKKQTATAGQAPKEPQLAGVTASIQSYIWPGSLALLALVAVAASVALRLRRNARRAPIG